MNFDPNYEVDESLLHSNQYLDTPASGLKLIASLLAGDDCREDRKIIDTLDNLIGVCGRLDQAEITEDFSKLRQILNLLQMPARSRLLHNTAIVGFGGQHNSGKSSILNSLMSEDNFRLPVKDKSSTSIPTYLMHANQTKVIACTRKGQEISIDSDALEAISHEFMSKHKINLAQFIEFIGISIPQFMVEGVALLDTPGYSVSDNSTQQDYRDSIRSQQALNSVDHLVWIIDIKKPVLEPPDRIFIKSLNLPGEITVIVNKCEELVDVYNSDEPECSFIIENIINGFNDADIMVSSVIAYSAREPEWNDGRNKVINFLHRIANNNKSAEERIKEVDNILSNLDKKFSDDFKKRFTQQIKEIDETIDAADNPLPLASLVQARGMMGYERSNHRKDYDIFKTCSDQIRDWINRK